MVLRLEHATLRAGFHARLEHAGLPGLVHAGDQHVPRTWLIDWHAHEVWELYLQLAGPATRWQVGTVEHVVPPGALLVVPPRVEHRMSEPAGDAYHFYFAAIDVPSLLDDSELVAVWERAEACSVDDAADLVGPFELFLREVATSQPFRVQGLRRSVQHLLIEATRLLLPQLDRRSLVVHPAVAEARRVLDSDLSAEVSLVELATKVHLSPTYLVQLFGAQIGESPGRYRQHRRLERARSLLAETDLRITDIAGELGFSSPQHFATAFRQQHGMTPRAFRSACRNGSTMGDVLARSVG